jgi:hypothetical protein
MADRTTGKAMTKRDVVLEALSQDYRRRRDELAQQLRPRIESGELAPWNGWDDRWEDRKVRWQATPNARLEKACRDALAPTREAAHLVLAVSPNGPAADGEERGASIDPCVIAGEAIAADVLEVGQRAGWYTPAPDPRQIARSAS